MTDDLDLFVGQEGEDGLKKPTVEGHLFLANLKHQDLLRLRTVVKRVYMQHYPTQHCTDREADRMIECIAPSVAERMLKALVDEKLERKDGSLNHGLLRLDQ